MTPTPRSKSESKRLAITGKEGPPTLRECWEKLRLVRDIVQEDHDNAYDEITWFLERLTPEALELDEKRVALDSRRMAALEELFEAAEDLDGDDQSWNRLYKALKDCRETKIDALTPTPKDESTSRGES